LFSRFRAVPPAVAALLSYNLECEYLGGSRLDYQEVVKRSALQPRAGREALLALFYPSPWLIRVTEPLQSASRTRNEIVKVIARQIRKSLEDKVGIGGETRRPLWQLLVRLEAKLDVWQHGRKAWRDLERQQSQGPDLDTAFRGLIARLSAEAKLEITQISNDELQRLADFALTAPGIVLGRSIYRHWQSSAPEHTTSLLEACWNGLRNYLDQPVFVRALGGGDQQFPNAIRTAIFQGNFEAVLDEHIWLIKRINGLEQSEIVSELLSGLRIRSSNVFVHSLTNRNDKLFVAM
jgi:hypothetical protein